MNRRVKHWIRHSLILTAPVMLVIAVVIKLDTPGPVFFWQIRMTKDRRNQGLQQNSNLPGQDRRQKIYADRPFAFVKFRTMYVDAREQFSELYDYTDSEVQEINFKVDKKHNTILLEN
jgi:lipopolysaccharide/colanic/teichoic acid biosynthesis glycosyltransferase